MEPWEPTQFALLIQNKGAGEAIDLRIETSDPTIVDNACNLPVQFFKLKCTVDGIDKDMNFNNINLGRIAPGQNIMARWWFYSNVMAHVANYEAHMTKHSNYGIEFDLITLDGVRELTHSVGGTLQNNAMASRRAPGKLTEDEKQTGIMLLNLIADEDNLPDHVMDMEGNETDDLEIVSGNATISAGANSGEYILTVTASRAGWVYGVTHDPTNCTMQLVKAVRQSDGADVTTNIWQTDRTVTANYSTIVDNRLHWADNMDTTESYTLYYEPKPAAAPAVKSIEPVVAEGSEPAKATRVIVTMADGVDTQTIDTDDVVVTVGERTYNTTVEVLSPTTFAVDWSQDRLYEGLLTVTVFTSGMKNQEGTSGTTNKSIKWIAEVDYLKGDANYDNVVDVADAVAIVNHVVGKKNAEFIMKAADANGDGDVDIADAVHIVNLIVGKISALARRFDYSLPEPQ